MCSVAGEAAPGCFGMQALLDAPTPRWVEISDASLHFETQSAEQPPPVDVSTNSVLTSDAVALPQALLKRRTGLPGGQKCWSKQS